MIFKSAKDLDWSKIKYFVPEEFSDPDHLGSWEYMSPTTVLLVEWLRKNTGWPIITHNRFGVHGCVCMAKGYHSPNSLHNYDCPDGCSAVDVHFLTKASAREQARAVLQSGFIGTGIYQNCWKWVDRKGESYVLPVAFHLDMRKTSCFQVWFYDVGLKLEGKDPYVYLLK